jgi:dCMP deaminase
MTQSEVIAVHLRNAYKFAWNNSPDPSTRVGAVIITQNFGPIYGCNCLPPGLDVDLTNRALKYKVIEHAERDAIFKATKVGYSLEGAIMYCPWAACCDCARAIVLSGIKEVVCHGNALDQTPERWREDIGYAKKIFECGGVKYTWWYGKVDYCQNLFDGEIWYP